MFSRFKQIFKKGKQNRKNDKYAFFKQEHLVSKIIPFTPLGEEKGSRS